MKTKILREKASIFIKSYFNKNHIINLVPILLIIILPIIVFNELTFYHKIPFKQDPLTQFYPFRAFAAAEINNGNIPLWNPYVFSGVPFLANIQVALFYPLNIILFCLFSLSTAFSLKIVIHFILAGLFTYIYARKLKISKFGSLLSGITFMFSGYLFPKTGLLPILQTAVWIPLLFYFFEMVIERQSIKYILLTGIILAVMILGGYPHIMYTTLIVLTIYSFIRIKFINIIKKEKITNRKSSVIKVLNILMKLNILYIIIIILSGGFTLSYSGFKFSATHLNNPLYFLILLFVIKVILSTKKIYFNWRLLFKCLAILGIIVVVGSLLSAIQLLPSLEFVNLSSKMGAETKLLGERNPVAFGHDLMLGNRKNPENSGFIGTIPLIFIILTIIIALRQKVPNINIFLFISFFIILIYFLFPPLIKILCFIPGFKLFPKLLRNISIFVFTLAISGGISFDIIVSKFNRIKINIFKNNLFRSLIKVIIISLTIIQLIYINSYTMRFVDPIKYYNSGEVLDFLNNDKSLYRIFEDIEWSCGYYKVKIGDSMIPNAAIYYRIFDCQGYDPLQLRAYKNYINSLNICPFFYPTENYAMLLPLNSRLIDLLNMKYILLNKKIEIDNHKLVYDKEIKIYQNNKVLPRAFIVHQWVIAREDYEAISWIQNGLVDVEKTVVLKNNFEGTEPSFDYTLGKKTLESEIKIEVYSAGLLAGNYAKIIVNGKRVEKNEKGYNIVVINPESGQVEQSVVFDTNISMEESEKMAKFIDSIEQGKIVVAAVKNDASVRLTEKPVKALHTIGSINDLRKDYPDKKIYSVLRKTEPLHRKNNKYFSMKRLLQHGRNYRRSHCIIGMKGLHPGQAVEHSSFSYSFACFPQTIPIIYKFKDNISSDQIKSNAKIVNYSPNKIVIDAYLHRRGFLFLSEIYYPGWSVYVDGNKSKILQANSIFRAVCVDKGRHKIEFYYNPLSFKLGLITSLISWISIIVALLLISLSERKLNKRKS